MKKTLQIVTSMAVGLSLAACGASANGGTTPSNIAPISANVLQFAVGTANYDGAASLNVVTTYRQPSGSYAPGDSGTLLNTPAITLPTAIAGPAATSFAPYDILSTVLYGPATGEVGNDTITSTSQAPTATTITSFGQSGGVFGLGIEPYNAQGSSSVTANEGNPADDGTPWQVAPYPVPLYDSLAETAASDPNMFVPWGGPPAFVASGSGGVSIIGNSNYPSGSAGLSEGIDVFYKVAPVAGSYTLTVVVPATTGAITKTATATLKAVTTIPTPTNPTYTPDGTGGGSFTGFVMPAGATEAYIQVTDYGPPEIGSGASAVQPVSCNGASAGTPVYYTIEVAAGGTPGSLADAIGPGGATTICTAAENNAAALNNPATGTDGDQVGIQVVAFDYPAFEMSYPNSLKNPSPTITGSAGTDDLAISGASCAYDAGAGVPASCTASLPLLKKRVFTQTYRRRIR